MSTRLKFPLGSQLAFQLSFGRDLTGAVLSANMKTEAATPDVAAFASSAGDVPQLAFSAIDLVAGDVLLTIAPGATAALAWPFARWQAKATFPTGEVVVLPEHQGPVVLTPVPAGLSIPGDDCVVDTITPESGSIAGSEADSATVKNRYDLTGLGIAAAGATKLSGLAATTLANWADGVVVRLYLAGEIMADYRLVTGAVGAESQWRVACDNSAGRYWKLMANPSKQGASTVWSAGLSKFKQVLEAGGALALADDADAFVIPD